MTASLKDLRRTREDAYRAMVIELGPPDPSDLDEGGEPLVLVSVHVPLSDARRMGSDLLYKWVEIVALEPSPAPGVDVPKDSGWYWARFADDRPWRPVEVGWRYDRSSDDLPDQCLELRDETPVTSPDIEWGPRIHRPGGP